MIEGKEGWEIFSSIIGWIYFLAWSVSFYPQVYTNWSRKSVTGLSFDYEFYNILGFSCLAIYNACLFWSPLIRQQYSDRFDGESPKVTTNDVFFGIHAIALTIVHIIQIGIYDRGRQKVSYMAMTLISGSAFAALLWTIVVQTSGRSSWLDVLYFLSYIKLSLTFIKYSPQVYMNWKRKSTVGWNIYNILLDFTGGSLSLLQLFLDCWIDEDWSGITGNPVKFGLGFVSMFFDVIFIIQHYCIYTDRTDKYSELNSPENDPLVSKSINSNPVYSFLAWFVSQEKPESYQDDYKN